MGSVVFAFLLIMVAGGFIAYFGDRLGYVMGKKRVTLFGMRPRHTATTLTVIAGVLIGAITLAFLIGVNKVFRRALLEGEQEFRTNISLRHRNNRLLNEAKADLAAASAAQSASNAAQRAESLAEAQTKAAQSGLVIASQKLTAEQAQLASKQADVAKLTASLIDEQAKLSIVQSKVNLETNELSQATLKLFKGVEIRREGNLIYRNQGEIGRVVIASGETQGEIRYDLVRFLNRLSLTATSHGAAIGANGRSVIIASLELLDQKPQDSGVFVDENGSLDALAASIHSHGSGSVVVVASALGNSFAGDHVIIVLRPYANVLVIHAGAEIAKTTIDGHSSNVNEIAADLQRFLVTQVRPTASKAGVIPVKNPLTGAEALGEITLQQLYEIVSEIRAIGAPAVVTASVDSDVYSADQLKLVFSVKPDTQLGN